MTNDKDLEKQCKRLWVSVYVLAIVALVASVGLVCFTLDSVGFARSNTFHIGLFSLTVVSVLGLIATFKLGAVHRHGKAYARLDNTLAIGAFAGLTAMMWAAFSPWQTDFVAYWLTTAVGLVAFVMDLCAFIGVQQYVRR